MEKINVKSNIIVYIFEKILYTIPCIKKPIISDGLND